MSATARAAPMHCPFCADEDLRPTEAVASDASGQQPARKAGWLCTACRRVFRVEMLGLSVSEVNS